MRRRDVHIICDCQRHALRERTVWRRSIRFSHAAVRQIRRGGIALLIGVPLAFGAIGIPTEAMDVVTLPMPKFVKDRFRVITPQVRERFLNPPATRPVFSLELTREQFFRTQVPYGSIIYREAVKNDLSPELLAAMVEAESDFRPRLISEKDARGLMQIIPSTGSDLGVDNLFDPQQNVAAGAKYMRYLLDRFNDPRIAIAAYNAGEGNIEKFGGVPPFPETLNYLRRVNIRRNEYRAQIREHYLVASRVQTMYGH